LEYIKKERTIQLTMLIIFTINILSCTNAQNIKNKEIIGQYNLKNNDPSSSSSIIIFKNQKYLISYFGGMQKGNWRIDKNIIHFSSDNEPTFVVYGRNLSILRDTTKIRFVVERSEKTLINYQETLNSEMKPIFNKNANCFESEYNITEIVPINRIDVSMNEVPNDEENGNTKELDVFQFDIPSTYNDLILVNLPKEYSTSVSFSATFNNNTLYLNGDTDGVQKRSLSELGKEQIDRLTAFSENSFLPNTLAYGNEFFPSIHGNKTHEEELKNFTKIKEASIKKQKIIIASQSLFIANCN